MDWPTAAVWITAIIAVMVVLSVWIDSRAKKP
jgi:hypothetical protein